MIPTEFNINVFKNVLAVAIIIYSGYIISRSYKINWDETQARVTESRKLLVKSYNEKPASHKYYFNYQYNVDNKTYTSNRYSLGGRDTSKAVCQYKTGDKIKIFFNSKDPAYAVVTYKVSLFIWGMFMLGLLMLFHNVLDAHLVKHKFDQKNKYIKVHYTVGALIATFIIGGFVITVVKVIIFTITNDCI